MELFSTIAAISTPPGRGGIGVIRISGPEAFAVADRVFRPMRGEGFCGMKGYTAKLGTALDGEGRALDRCVGLCFRAPRSYTGEDVAELQCHGGETVTRAVLRAVLDAGAHMAGRGEFTRRAFLSGKLTLSQAEAVMELVDASSEQGQRAAASLAEGALSEKARQLRERILAMQAHIAADIDFPEEDVEPADRGELLRETRALLGELSSLLSGYETGQRLLRGIPAILAGSPNVGKSTLLNRIAGYERAIVSSEAGTTRDLLEQQVSLGGVTLLLADSAGMREQAGGEIERLGISLAKKRLQQSSLVLAVFDASRSLSADDRALMRLLTGEQLVLAVLNKCDLPSGGCEAELAAAFPHLVKVSALQEQSLPQLDRAVSELLGTDRFDENAPLLANERQRSCAAEAKRALQAAEASLSAGETLDVCYALFSEALSALFALDGENAAEEVIDRVFQQFCVGK